MGRKSEQQIKCLAELGKYKEESMGLLSELIASSQALADTYFHGYERLNKDYNKMLKLIEPGNFETSILLDYENQRIIEDGIFSMSSAIGQISFALGMQMGIKFMKNLESDRLIEDWIEKGIIF